MDNIFFSIMSHKDVTYATSFKESGNVPKATVDIKRKLGDARPEMGGNSHEIKKSKKRNNKNNTNHDTY